MWKFFFEFILYASFVSVLYIISYSNHNAAKFQQVQHFRQLFLNPDNYTYNFLNVRIFLYCIERG